MNNICSLPSKCAIMSLVSSWACLRDDIRRKPHRDGSRDAIMRLAQRVILYMTDGNTEYTHLRNTLRNNKGGTI